MSHYSPRIIVTRVISWGGNCPFQIEAMTSDNRPIYLRARYNGMTVSLGTEKQKDGVSGADIFYAGHPDDDYAWGHIELDDIVKVTAGFIRWPWRFRLRAWLWPLGRPYRNYRFRMRLEQLNQVLEEDDLPLG